MDYPKKFELSPLPVEKEFRIQSVKHRVHELSREDLETFLIDALDTMTRLAHQVNELRDFIEYLEGKTE